jgi:hypothetical protein
MGIEYNIRYQPHDHASWERFVERLDNPVSNGWPEFTIPSLRGLQRRNMGRESRKCAVAMQRPRSPLHAFFADAPTRINRLRAHNGLVSEKTAAHEKDGLK